ncbi:putative s-adenosyl-l-methionine-dependent methyltransferase [Erysiphe neolycopersici]|uniref:Putative s-adenosyl-l-methionine-dependent methyltransferase n=1 Tax=Erysiphe neolycopersici TaxID=212602 RepID=A0A420HUF5_9PEZI|nr:putative s-adenosyl-l-methionine-dependent methyltransferase [Erysiphe neolycopersici]
MATGSDNSRSDFSDTNNSVKTLIHRELITEFFIRKDTDFKRLSEFRHRGWITNKEKADAYFDAQRKRADFANAKTQNIFFKMMVQIAEEMHLASNIFYVQKKNRVDFRILDICMAPGGYTAAVLKFLPFAKCFCLTLPLEKGGHDILIDKSRLEGLKLLDITLLIKEYSDKLVPHNYPGKSDFSNLRPFHCHKFDLIFCDGMVLRTHSRPEWREDTEATRLLLSQLILSMQRLRSGGTIVILLHKVENWESILTIKAFSAFSDIQLFKPVKKHNTRSSFYMIAKNIDIHCEAAQNALHDWRDTWWEVTFGGEKGFGEKKNPDKDVVLKTLEEFGDQLIQMAKPIWKIQADALAMTDYAGGGL